jgi:hypothetical protein
VSPDQCGTKADVIIEDLHLGHGCESLTYNSAYLVQSFMKVRDGRRERTQRSHAIRDDDVV